MGAKLIKGSSVPSPFYFTCFFFVANNIIKVKVRVNVPIFYYFLEDREGGGVVVVV